MNGSSGGKDGTRHIEMAHKSPRGSQDSVEPDINHDREPRPLTDSELERAMQAILPLSDDGMECPTFSNTIFNDIANLLHQAGRTEWSLRPRTYAVLRQIDAAMLIDDFINQDFWDIALPYSYNTLPQTLSPSKRTQFLKKQNLVLTEAASIEGGPASGHANFREDADAHLESLNELGRGGYGSVDRVRSKLSRKVYVRKRMKRSTIFENDKNALRVFKNEIENLRRLKHHHLVRYVGSYTDPRYAGILMEPVADCDMQAFLSRTSFSSNDYTCIRQAFGCLAAAILYLQEKNCRHKDIKPHNILVKAAKVYITDFGIARDWTGRGRSTTTGAPGAVSPEYAAPEVMDHQPRNSSSDIWSLGCVFLEMVTILKGETLSSKVKYFQENDTLGTNPRTNPGAYKSWVRQLKLVKSDGDPLGWISNMICKDPKARLTAQQLMAMIRECADENQYCGFCCDGQEDEKSLEELRESEFEGGSSSEVPSSADEFAKEKTIDPITLEKRLCDAAKSGNIMAVKRWLRRVSRMLSKERVPPQSFQTKALHHAAGAGHEDVVLLLIRFGCDLDAKWQGRTPLILAARHSHESIVELLAKNKAKVNSREESTGGTALHIASTMGLHAAIKALLECGANVDFKDGARQTPLHCAATKNDPSVVKLLLDYNATVSLRDKDGATALNRATFRGLTTIVTQLLDHGADINAAGPPTYRTALVSAAHRNVASVAQLLLQRGADINLQFDSGDRTTALHIATGQGNLEVMKVLLGSKTKPNLELRDRVDLTPIYYAIRISNPEALRLLLEAGADANVKSANGVPVLWHVVSDKKLELAQLLISHGANLEIQGNQGERLLQHVVTQNDEERLQFMLNNKANIEAMDYSGATALLIAAKSKRLTSLGLLLQNGANAKHKDHIGRTALHFAASAGPVEAVSVLLAFGADPKARNDAGYLPIAISHDFRQTEVEELLHKFLIE